MNLTTRDSCVVGGVLTFALLVAGCSSGGGAGGGGRLLWRPIRDNIRVRNEQPIAGLV